MKKILGFRFSNVFKEAAHSYRNLADEDQYTVNSYLAILFVILFIVWVAGVFFHEYTVTPVGKTAEAILLAIWVAITFSVFDRLQILSPIEQNINTMVSNLGKLADKLEATNALDSTEFDKKLRQLAEYNKYTNARLSFGFNAVVGVLETQRVSGAPFSGWTSVEIFNSVVDRAAPDCGTTIKYMNTFIRDSLAFREIVKRALQGGINVKILLMMPSENAAVVEARRLDYYQESHISAKDFADSILSSAKILLNLRNEMQDQRQYHPNYGALEIVFYTKSLNFPLIISTEKVQQRVEEVAYTGFYAGTSAETMPYIEWRGGDFQIIKKFHNVFDSKWQACKSKGFTEIVIKS